MTNVTHDPRADTDKAALIDRFESIYASLAIPEDEPAPAAAAAPLFGLDDFELPATNKQELHASTERVDAVMKAPSPQPAEIGSDAAEETDLDEAFAILRAGEKKARAGAQRAADPDAEAEAKAESAHEQRVVAPLNMKGYRRYAVPALVATVFVGVATGYLVTRHSDSPTAASTAVPRTPLKLDYQLQHTRTDAIVVGRAR